MSAAFSLGARLLRGDDAHGELADELTGLIVRSRRPLDLETPVATLDAWTTPNDRFFVRSHFGSPAVAPGPWLVELSGLVEHPSRKPLAELLGSFERVTMPAVLQCAGNGRAFFDPIIPGVAWERGAVGQAEWTGVRLADVLRHAGLKPGAAHVQFTGADGPPSPKTPPWHRSIPLDRALDPQTMLATEMNGVPLPLLHGGPLRLVVPGWSGNHWMKWVRSVVVAREESSSFYMRSGYKLPVHPAPPDAIVPPGDMKPVTWMNVKSLITHPVEGTVVDGDSIEVRGVAWTGAGTVARVQVGVGPVESWQDARFLDPARPGSWRRWEAVVRPGSKGPSVLGAQATDTTGATQPEKTPWNKSGYLWNGIDHVRIELRG